jgi:hypothetical protein
MPIEISQTIPTTIQYTFKATLKKRSNLLEFKNNILSAMT